MTKSKNQKTALDKKPLKKNEEPFRIVQICWTDSIRPRSIEGAQKRVESIMSDLKKLAQMKKEGKIKTHSYDRPNQDDALNYLRVHEIEVLDESIVPELKKIGIVYYWGWPTRKNHEMQQGSESETPAVTKKI